MILYFIRHGETEFNRDKRYQGNLNIPLSKEGAEKVQKADFEPEVVYVSGLKRTAETAAILFPNAKQRRVPGLNEMNFGIFEGRNADEMEFDPAYRDWVDHNCETRCPGGEDKAEFSERVCRAFEEVMQECLAEGREEVVIVSHGGTIMTILEAYGNPKRDFYGWLCGNALGFVFEYDPPAALGTMQLIDEVAYAADFVEMKI